MRHRALFFVWIENNNGRQFIRTTQTTPARFASYAYGEKSKLSKLFFVVGWDSYFEMNMHYLNYVVC